MTALFALPVLAQESAPLPSPRSGETVRKLPGAQRDTSQSTIESLDFDVVDTGSRITMKVGGSCIAAQPVRQSEGLSFTVNRCFLPHTLRRSLDTSAFPSAVQSVTTRQVSLKGIPETRVFVKLNQAATWSLNQENGTILLSVNHPKISVQEPQLQPQAQPQTQPQLQSQSASPPSGARKTYSGRKVTLEFVDADIRKIFQLIAEVSNLNILLGDDVTGTISIRLINVPWDQALDVILEAKGLGMRTEGNIVLIKPQSRFKSSDEEALEAKRSREKMMELKTRVFDVNFAQSSDVVAQFKTLGSGRSDSSITQDERTNKVIVTDIEPAVNRMKSFLESIDIPEQQVLIEARIVEASDNFTRNLGIQWGVHYRDASASVMGINSFSTGFGGAVTAPPLTGTYGPGMATGISFGTLASNINVDLRLSAAATADLIKIISTPKIATLNNKAAKITQGQSIPYQNTTANTGAVTQFVEAALSLEVTPHITPDGNVIMKIKASNNSPGTIPPGGTAPPINKKEATTELIVHSGDTTVIGGIYIDNDTENNSGVPFLMDIPFIGWLFKSNTKSKTKSELLIFITPRILSSGGYPR
jgi:type IV pilus assembly protein PilQ